MPTEGAWADPVTGRHARAVNQPREPDVHVGSLREKLLEEVRRRPVKRSHLWAAVGDTIPPDFPSGSVCTRSYSLPVWLWGLLTGLDSGDPRCRRKMDRTISTPMERNSLCQFCID